MRYPLPARAVLLAAGLAALAAFAPAARAEPMFKGGPALAGTYAAPSPFAWRGIRFAFRAGAPIRSTPARAGGTLYFSTGGTYFFSGGGGVTSPGARIRMIQRILR